MSGPLPEHSTIESIGYEGRATTVVQVDEIVQCGESVDLPLREVIDTLQRALKEIPETCRGTAVLRISASGEYASVNSAVTYTRPETDAELADRRRWLSSIDEEREASDQREFKRLSAKYGATQK